MSLRNGHIRWAFDFVSWKPTLIELLQATACIQSEEKIRLAKFVFREDFAASLIGRLLLRKFVRDVTNLPYNKIIFDRDERGKPFLMEKHLGLDMDFNVSHQGCFAVLAGCISPFPQVGITSSSSSSSSTATTTASLSEIQYNEIKSKRTTIGVDVMKIEYTGGKPLTEFFRLMDRNFSAEEWGYIKKWSNEMEKLQAFMRNWCLKEGYVKNIGIGITIDLKKISFAIRDEYETTNKVVQSTTLTVDGVPMDDWLFEESLIDVDHCVAVALCGKLTKTYTPMPFKILNFHELMEDCIPLLPNDYDYCQTILNKPYKNIQ